MTKAYLAGFIAGANGKDWEDNPYKDHEGSYTQVAIQWRKGCDDGHQVICGVVGMGAQEVDQ